MGMLGGFSETSDISDKNEEIKTEISRDAQNKFEKIMGDENLQEKYDLCDAADQCESYDNLMDKFAELFNEDNDSIEEFVENITDSQFSDETSDTFQLNCEETQEGILMDGSDKVEAEDGYRLPRNGGEWSGVPGNSKWKPDPNTIPGDRNGTNPEAKSWKKIMNQYNIDGIPFENGRADFSEMSKGNVEIDNFSDNRRKNFVQADEKLAEQKGCQASDVRQWRLENRYTWHEEADCKTMCKVPSEVHGNIPHDGGISEIKSQKESA